MMNGVAHIIESEPNPNYPSEFTRTISKVILYIMPTGQALEMIPYEEGKDMQEFLLYSLGTILVVNGIGIYLFNKKELK